MAADHAAARLNMVESQVRPSDVTDVRLHDVMRSLPREACMPPGKAYQAAQLPQAQALLESTEGLTPDALTEWQQKVAWIYFQQGDDNNARAMAVKAAQGWGDWAVQGYWVGALAAWRQHDCAAAGSGFETVAARASDIDMRAAGLYWASRADMQCGRPDRVEARLKNAAQYRETFYGLLARQALARGPHAA